MQMHSPQLLRLNEVGAYWATQSGIMDRLGMLSQRAVYGIYNTVIRSGAKALGAKMLVYHTEQDDRVCMDCEPFEGREYNMGQFLPYIPRHPGCRCWWEPVWIPERPIEYVV